MTFIDFKRFSYVLILIDHMIVVCPLTTKGQHQVWVIFQNLLYGPIELMGAYLTV